jgi:hypothetical protein
MKKFLILITFLVSSYTFVIAQTNEDVTVSASKTGAYIQFDNPIFNFDTLIFGQEAKHDFFFKNTGTDTLKISEVRSTCGCTVPKWNSNAIAPGQSDKITVIYDSHRSGGFSKGITIYSNARNNEVIIMIEGEITDNPNKPILGQ